MERTVALRADHTLAPLEVSQGTDVAAPEMMHHVVYGQVGRTAVGTDLEEVEEATATVCAGVRFGVEDSLEDALRLERL